MYSRLEGSGLKLYYVMIPVWIGLPILTLDVFMSMFDTDILEFLANLNSFADFRNQLSHLCNQCR